MYPNLYKHFLSLGFSTSMYGSSWFVTLFASCLSLNVVYRVIDAFLVDGMAAVFRVGLALLQCDSSQLLNMDIETMLKHFQKGMRDEHEADPSHLILTAWSIKWDSYTKKMKKWQQEFIAKKEKMQEENLELKRLRAENDSLHIRLSQLERECESLAGKLIQGQVSRAQEAENMYILEKEIRVLRRMSKKVSIDGPPKSSSTIPLLDTKESEGFLQSSKTKLDSNGGGVFSDSDQDTSLVESEDLVRALSQEPLHRVNSSTSGGRVLELEKELAAQKIEAEEAADELERKRCELQEAETREEQLKQQLDSANVKIATLEEHVSIVLQMTQSLVSVQILCVHTLIHLLHLSVGVYTCLYIRMYIDVYVSVRTCTAVTDVHITIRTHNLCTLYMVCE
jgi:predicted  nucleic acid-binding Zn-ribbon protein